jgi:hypothetical protein
MSVALHQEDVEYAPDILISARLTGKDIKASISAIFARLYIGKRGSEEAERSAAMLQWQFEEVEFEWPSVMSPTLMSL